MGKKLGRKHIEKKRARQKAVKKVLIEKRLADRKEKRLEREKELIYEREFNEKNKLGLSKEEVKQRLEQNLKILEVLEQQMIAEEAERGKSDLGDKAQAQLEAIEDFGKLQGELINLQVSKKESQEKNEWSDEKEKQFLVDLERITASMEELKQKRENNVM
jgi:hypothetical protein